MKLGILGRPQSGKTTVFNAAACQSEAVGDFSKATHRSLIKIPDNRLLELAKLVNPKKITYATVEFLDTPGLSGHGKASKSLEISAELRQAEAFMLVVDAFSPDAKPEVDIRSLIDEMILLDHLLVESNLERRARKVKLTGDKSEAREIELLSECLVQLEQEKPLIDCEFNPDDEKKLKGYQFLTQKPILVVLNISECDIENAEEIVLKYSSFFREGKCELTVMCGKIEMELVSLDNDEREMFMTDLGITASATDVVIQKSYKLLGLISFLTAGEPEVRAWTIRAGTTAQMAAGVIHSDIERGFIRAEVTAYDDYITLKSQAAIKAAGKQRLEGKQYLVTDGDVILFRFNV